MSSHVLNRVAMTLASAPLNTNPFALAGAVPASLGPGAWQTASAAGAVDAAQYDYVVVEGTTLFECGIGTYNYTAQTLSRDTIYDSSAGFGTKASFSAAAIVYFAPTAQTLQTVLNAVSTAAASATAAAASATSAATAASTATTEAGIAAAAVSSMATAYNLDGLPPAAIVSVPKLGYYLNGSPVALSSLLSFSSAQKYTVAANGNYVLNGANGPAYDWSTGRRRLLIEGVPSTNYWTNSEVIANGGNCTASVASSALLGVLALATLTQTATGAALVSVGSLAQTNGSVASFTVALVAGSLSTSYIGIYGSVSGWGVNADTTATVVSGPGTVSQNTGGLWNVSGLTSTPTIVSVTRTFRQSETAYPYVYLSPGGGSAGATLKVGRPQFEPGYPSSYIASGSSATTRAGDVVTVSSSLLTYLTAANASFAARGAVVSTSSTLGPVGDAPILDSGNSYGGLIHAPSSALLSYQNGSNSVNYGTSYSSNTIADAAAMSATQAKISSGGAAIASGSITSAILSGTDTSIQIGGGYYWSQANILLDELVVWPFFGSDAGIQNQARVYS